MFINLILSLANSFLLEMVIAKEPSYLSLQYFMYSVTVACHLTLCSNNMVTHNERIIDSEFLSASTFLLYMYQPKNGYLSYINCIILIEGVMNRTIHNIFVCMYKNRVLIYIDCV